MARQTSTAPDPCGTFGKREEKNEPNGLVGGATGGLVKAGAGERDVGAEPEFPLVVRGADVLDVF